MNMPQRVRPDGLVDPGTAGDAAHDPSGAVPVEPGAGIGEEDRSVRSLADREIDRPRSPGRERDGDDPAALARDGQGAVAAFDAEAFDVGVECF
jgi:hypothetical protein